jgi:hypothetical protein
MLKGLSRYARGAPLWDACCVQPIPFYDSVGLPIYLSVPPVCLPAIVKAQASVAAYDEYLLLYLSLTPFLGAASNQEYTAGITNAQPALMRY